MASRKVKNNSKVTQEMLDAASNLSLTTSKFTLVCDRAGGVDKFLEWVIAQREQTPAVPFKTIAPEIETRFNVHVSVGTLWDWVQRLDIEPTSNESGVNTNG